jgi:hypothetical protein
MNYKLKYLKYKQKYINLTKNNLKGGTRAKQIYFNNKIEDDKELLSEFRIDMVNYSEKSTPCRMLGSIFNNYIDKIKINFYLSDDEELTDCYLIFVVGNNDELLIKLAQTNKFPRGFPILWIPKKRIHFFGFYPKFDNDKKRADDDDIEFDNAISIDFNYKYSGFLAQPLVFQYNDKNYWTVCSKNQPFNRYAKWATNIFSEKITDELIDDMIKNNIHIAGECMSFCDQMHGTRVLKECIAITMVAVGHDVLNNSEIVTSGSTSNFNDYKTQNETLQFCNKHNLSIDSIFEITGDVKEFIQMLSNNRDQMTLSKLTDFINLPSTKFTKNIISGSISHETILGDCLEGLIIKIKYSDKPVKIVKYKFPNYTIRTMFLRDKAIKFISVWYSPTFYSLYNQWVNRWVIKDKDYWNFIGTLIVKNYLKLKKEYEETFPVPIPYSSDIEADCRVGFHIWLMDKITQLKEFIFNPELNYVLLQNNYKLCNDREGKDLLEKLPTFHIIILLGAIGSGKSSYGNIIEKLDKHKFKHIDGDLLNTTEEEVLKLGKRRNIVTQELIRDTLFENKIPIISTGGGALLTSNHFKFDDYLINELKKNKGILNAELKFTILITSLIDESIFIDKSNYFYNDDETYKNKVNIDIKNLYENKSIFDSAIKSRIDRGNKNWAGLDKNKINSIHRNSINNYNISLNIINTIEQNCKLNHLILLPLFDFNNKIIINDFLSKTCVYFKNLLNNVTFTPMLISEFSESPQKLLYKSIKFNNNNQLLKLFNMIIKKTGLNLKERFKQSTFVKELHCTTEYYKMPIDFIGEPSTKKRTIQIDSFIYDNDGLAFIVNKENIASQLIADGFNIKDINSEYHITFIFPKTKGPVYSNELISDNIKGLGTCIKQDLDEKIIIDGFDNFVFAK